MPKQALPFGKPFKYTTTLPTNKRSWFRRIFQKKPPAAWITTDDDQSPITAHIMHRSGEVKISPVEPGILAPVRDVDQAEDLFIAAAEKENDV